MFMKHAAYIALIATCAAALTAAGCATRVTSPDPSGNPELPPVPTSASNVLRLLEWCYEIRSTDLAKELFAADYRFFFSSADSSASQYRGTPTPWTREDELICMTHLFVGGGALAPASSITLALDNTFLVQPDLALAPWDVAGRWHKTITTQESLVLHYQIGEAIDASGVELFHFVRGDSALIPEELQQRGYGPDSTRWYIRRWEELPQPIVGMRAQYAGARDAGPMTCGALKVLYR
jgi:hypothetical protein